MKFFQTLWTGPQDVLKDDALNMKAGWLSPEYHWMSWALSCLQAKSVFGNINLVTDNKGKEILIDQLQLPYSTVSTDLEEKFYSCHPALFALAKIYTYSIQTGPFLHLDSDVFLWHRPGQCFLDSRLIAQNTDKNLPFYLHTLNSINQHFGHIPGMFSKANYENRDIYASNAGLLGGNDPEFFKEYSYRAFDFINQNKAHLDKLDAGSLNFIIEQYLFYHLAEERGIPVSYLKGVVDDPVFKEYINFEGFPEVQLIHPVGGFKKMPHVCEHVATKLRNDYPDYYYRIINLVRAGNQNMRSAIYYNPFFNHHKLSPLPAEAVRSVDKTALFPRTKAAIDYLNNKHSFNLELDLVDETTENGFVAKTSAMLPDERENECLLEIFRMESKKNSMTYSLHADGVSILYKNDAEAYRQIQDTFSMPESELMAAKVEAVADVVYFDLQWEWSYDNKGEVEAIVERNFNSEPSSFCVLLLPGVLQMDVREYYIDELDIIVFNTITHALPIAGVLNQMEAYFSAKEIQADYSSFKLLIVKTIKQLLYAGAAKIIV